MQKEFVSSVLFLKAYNWFILFWIRTLSHRSAIVLHGANQPLDRLFETSASSPGSSALFLFICVQSRRLNK